MRRTVVLIVLLTFALGTSVEAQPQVSVRGNVGAAFFQSPDGLNNVLNSGVDLGLGVGIELYEGLEIVLQGSYDRFTLNGDNVGIIDEELTVESTVDGGDFDVLNGSIGLRYTLRNQSDAHPYVSGGVGIYRTVFARTRSDQGDEIFPRETPCWSLRSAERSRPPDRFSSLRTRFGKFQIGRASCRERV